MLLPDGRAHHRNPPGSLADQAAHVLHLLPVRRTHGPQRLRNGYGPGMAAPDLATRPFGIDFGGSGIKGAPVDLTTGEFAAERTRMETPSGGHPQDVAEVVAELVAKGAADGVPVGITVPAVVVHGVVKSAANIDKSWIYTDAETMFRDKLRRDVVVVNDADAAGLAEVRYGAARNQEGLVVVTTLGTGIGTALVYDGELVPNAELGHIEIDGKDAETVAANSVREKKDLSWEKWAERLTTYYRTLERLLSPELFVVGGGVSKNADKFLPAGRHRDPDRAGHAAQHRGHRRRRGARRGAPHVMSGGGAGSTAVTRAILPSADLAATPAFYAGLGFVEVGQSGVPAGRPARQPDAGRLPVVTG